MTLNLTCTQVSALLAFYLDNRLNDQLSQFVSAHLDICPMCKAKYEALKGMVADLKQAHEKLSQTQPENTFDAEEYDEFKTNLSAYVDSELSDDENIKVKKYVVSHPKARKQLEDMYTLRKVIQTSFEKTKHDAKIDYSKFILKRIDIQEEVYGPDSFAKVVALFIVIFALFTLGAVLVFWI